MSMGWHAARKLRRALDGLGRVLGIELLTATRALDFRAAAGAGAPAAATAAIHQLFRSRIAPPSSDDFVSPDIEAAHEFVVSGAALAAAERALGGPLR